MDHFNPRSPCGERPSSGSYHTSTTHFNPRSPCGERPLFKLVGINLLSISIHAPPAGSDLRVAFTCSLFSNFNPRSPCGERRDIQHNIFKFTDFNPRSPCGERQRKFSINLRQNGIKSKNKLNRCNKKRHEQHEKSANLSDIHWAMKGRAECGEIQMDGANIP